MNRILELIPQWWTLLASGLLIWALAFFCWTWGKRRLWKVLNVQPLPSQVEFQSVRQQLDRLARRARIAVPRLAWIDDFSPTALVLDRGRQPVVVVTRGLLQTLAPSELEGVLAICLARVKSRDRWRSHLAFLLAYPIARLARKVPIAIGLILQTAAASFVRVLVRPSRWYEADSLAQQLTQNPDAVAIALRRLIAFGRRIPFQHQNVAVDQLLVVSAIHDDLIASTCATHPAPEDRVRRLLGLSTPCVSTPILQ